MWSVVSHSQSSHRAARGRRGRNPGATGSPYEAKAPYEVKAPYEAKAPYEPKASFEVKSPYVQRAPYPRHDLRTTSGPPGPPVLTPRQTGAPPAPSPSGLRPAPVLPAPILPVPGGRVAARRAVRQTGRRRRHGTSPEALRRLLPRALVVAFLAGGTTAFIAHDKAVRLTVDGTPRTLHTFADDVDDLLADEDLDIGGTTSSRPPPAPRSAAATTSSSGTAGRWC